MVQWNWKSGDLLSPRPALCMVTSPRSGNALDVTDKAGPAAPLPPPRPPPPGPPGPPGPPPLGAPPPGACADIMAPNAKAPIVKSTDGCINFFIRNFSFVSELINSSVYETQSLL